MNWLLHPRSQTPNAPTSTFDVRRSAFGVLTPFASALLLLVLLTLFPSPSPAASDSPKVFIVVGASGEGEFGASFARQAQLWEKASDKAGATRRTIGLDPQGATDDFTLLRQALEFEPKDGPDAWLVLIGHGTFDGQEARFNLRGPDLSAADLAAWLQPFHRRFAIINTASSSAPFLKALSASNRVVITATRSGYEQNYTRFGGYIAEALDDPAADLDQDGQTSLLECFLSASFRVAEFYKSEGRLATEHPLLDDNADGLGTPADWFRGLRAVKRPQNRAALDGLRAHQLHLIRSAADDALTPEARQRRDRLEIAIAELRETKANLAEDAYYARLEPLVLELARLYASAPEPSESPKPTAPQPPRSSP